MPTNRRSRRLERRETTFSERTRANLLHGHDWPMLRGEPMDDDELAEAWGVLGDELLAAFIAEQPGCRPWAWWRWQAPEPRLQINDGPEPLPGHGLWFGKPRGYTGQPPEDMFEPEAEYLERLGLLTAGEREALAAK